MDVERGGDVTVVGTQVPKTVIYQGLPLWIQSFKDAMRNISSVLRGRSRMFFRRDRSGPKDESLLWLT